VNDCCRQRRIIRYERTIIFKPEIIPNAQLHASRSRSGWLRDSRLRDTLPLWRPPFEIIAQRHNTEYETEDGYARHALD
jgi:hypothetical protein